MLLRISSASMCITTMLVATTSKRCVAFAPTCRGAFMRSQLRAIESATDSVKTSDNDFEDFSSKV